MSGRRVLFSLPHAPTFEVVREAMRGACVEVERRASDWGKRGWRKRLWHLWEGIRVAWQARSFDVLVLCSVSVEAFVVGWVSRWLCPRTRVVVVDFLIPRRGRVTGWLGLGLRQIDGFVCIRTGDIRTLVRRFRVERRRCGFAHYPARGIEGAAAAGRGARGGYVYSAGFAHRDWPTLIEALRRVSVRAILSPGFDFQVPAGLPVNIQLVPPMPPEEGRRLLAGARLAVFALEETELPCGPLVLLDAMVLGKPIIATRTNATRDYLQHGETAWMVEPRDVEALAGAIECLWKDAPLAEELSEHAMQVSARAFTNAGFLARIDEACEAGRWEDRTDGEIEEGMDWSRQMGSREGSVSEGWGLFD